MQQLALIEANETDSEVIRRHVTLPFTPPSKNVYDSWQPLWKAGLRKKWRRHLLEAFEELQFPVGAEEVGVAFRLVFGSKRRRDWQNYAPVLYHVVPDALVTYGVIPDDTPDRFKVGPNGGIEFGVDSRPVAPKLRQRTEIAFAIRV